MHAEFGPFLSDEFDFIAFRERIGERHVDGEFGRRLTAFEHTGRTRLLLERHDLGLIFEASAVQEHHAITRRLAEHGPDVMDDVGR